MDDPKVSAGQTKVVLMGVFLSAAAVVGLNTGGVHLSPFEWLMLGLAALRCGRMIAFELIAEPFRRPFAVVQPHQYAGDTTEPRYDKGWKASIGQAITCPMCAGTWSAAALLYMWLLVPGPAQILITIFSAVSVLEIGHSLIELLCWGSAYYRKESR